MLQVNYRANTMHPMATTVVFRPVSSAIDMSPVRHPRGGVAEDFQIPLSLTSNTAIVVSAKKPKLKQN